MQVIDQIAGLRTVLAGRGPIVCVPTMGNLHAGHIDLMRLARGEGRTVVATIFVNRLQFGPNEDFDRYPRTLGSDSEKLTAAGVDILFTPRESEFYRTSQTCRVEPTPAIADILEGEFRPGFFRGVATVVLKLFNIVGPQVAVFGKKDYQQLTVIRDMVRQFALPVRIIAGETARADDGLALSSRNGYLSALERAEAPRLHRSLAAIRTALERGASDVTSLEQEAFTTLAANGWKPDYVTVRRQHDLLPPTDADGALVVLAAARLGTTRLIDNLEIALAQ